MHADPSESFVPSAFSDPSGMRATCVRHSRVMPGVVAELGELVGVIYRPRCSARRARTFIHFMRDLPLLVHSLDGGQLYVVGGSYRVTPRGIEG
jgi:hypothetical protein